MAMFTTGQIQTLQDLLVARRDQLLENAEKAMGLTRDRDNDQIGRDSIDESTQEWMYSTALRLHDREKFLLNKIESALKRLQAGEIDECSECGDPIGFARLQARPVTTMCIGCKEDREQNEG